MPADSSEEEGSEGEGSEEGASSDSDDDEAPAAVPLRDLGRRAAKPRARSLVDDEAEEASSQEEGESDEDMEGELKGGGTGGKAG